MSSINLESEGSQGTELASYFTCEICIEPVLSTQMFLHKDNVAHNFCVMCIGSHIQANVEQNKATILCPDDKCDKTLDPVVECQPLITNDVFVKLCDRLCESVIAAGSNKYYCPYKKCSEVLIDECDGRINRCACPRCNRPFCYKCKTTWLGAEHRCSEKRDSKDRKFLALVEKMRWTRCPGCGQPTERISGCRHVQCRCGTWFDHGYVSAYLPLRLYLFLREIALYVCFFFGALGMIALVFIVVFLVEKLSRK